MIYYAAEKEGKVAIYRLYLPELRTDAVYEEIPVSPVSNFRLIPPTSTRGRVGFTMLNPELLELMTAEYAKPDSKYKNISPKFDFSEIWGAPNLIDDPRNMGLVQAICQAIQEKSGILALVRGWYDPVTDQRTQELGAIDDCFTGTGLRHDHFAPEAPEPAVPEIHVGPWEELGLAPLPQSTEVLLAETADQDAALGLLYAAPYAYPTLYAGEPLAPVLQEVSLWETSRYYLYAITRDGKLVQVSPDGSICNTLYSARYGTLQGVDYQCGVVYLIDGDRLIQLELTTMRQRELLRGECMVECRYYDENTVYICQSRGLHQKQYLLDPEAQSLQETVFN